MTLDSDVEALLRKRMEERHVSFKDALNSALREGLAGKRRSGQFQTPTAELGLAVVNLDRALQLAAELEDEELLRKMRVGK